jgi:hypothetical protein
LAYEDALAALVIEKDAQDRYSTGYSEAQFRANRYDKWHKYYAPTGGDQWPEDLTERPGKLHFTVNLIRGFVDTEARLLSIKPRFILPADLKNDEEMERRAETTEKLFARYLDNSGFDEWSFTFNQIKSLYGLGILRPFWNDVTNMPDVTVVEQPQNVMFGWGDSNFLDVDWAIYHYAMSGLRAKRKYPELDEETIINGSRQFAPITLGGGDHADPVETLNTASRRGRQVTDYERSHVPVWDYWFLGNDEDGKEMVYNATLVAGKLVEGPIEHPELPTVPYIPVESDHEPGSPDGHGTAEMLLDLQMGLNRAVSHYAQHVWDTTDPAYQLEGPEAPMVVPAGLVPVPGEIVAPGPGARITEIRSGVNNFPFDSLINTYWTTAHRLTGLSEILFGTPPGAQTSARALQAQLDSSINRLDPKRRRYYEGLRALFSFWHHMLLKKNPKIDDIAMKDVITGLNNWKIVAPEISPRDMIEHTQNVLNKVNGKLISTQTAMDEVGVDNPLEELDRIMAERSNAHLYPSDAQAIAAVTATLQAIGAQQQQAEQVAAQGQGQATQAVQAGQEAAPTLDEGDNQLATEEGMIGGELRPIVREAGGGGPGAMSELRLPTENF